MAKKIGTQLGKVFAVCVASGSLAFMGISVVATIGGPNWRAEALEVEKYGYEINLTEGQWNGVNKQGNVTVKQSKVLPAVLVDVLKDINKNDKSEIERLSDFEKKLTESIAEMKAAIAMDEKALQLREEELRKRLAITTEEVRKLGTKAISNTEEALEKQSELKQRREDVYRLQSQVKEAQADLYRQAELIQQLKDQIIQVEGTLERSLERSQQLQGKGQADVYNPPPKDN